MDTSLNSNWSEKLVLELKRTGSIFERLYCSDVSSGDEGLDANTSGHTAVARPRPAASLSRKQTALLKAKVNSRSSSTRYVTNNPTRDQGQFKVNQRQVHQFKVTQYQVRNKQHYSRPRSTQGHLLPGT